MGMLESHYVVDSFEITGVALHTATGDVPGYQVRFFYEDPKYPKSPIPGELHFFSESNLEALVRQLAQHMQTKGHLSPEHSPKGPPH